MGVPNKMERKSKGKKLSKIINTRIKGKKRLYPSIFSLPNELVTEILARVAASSLTDIFNTKLSCKFLHEIANNDLIYRQVSLEKIDAVPWRITKQASSFLERCKQSGNPEALYRQGVVEYFSCKKLESGLGHLHRAANSGHLGASYVLGVILLCNNDGDKSEQQGVKLLNNVHSAIGMGECRRKLKEITDIIWLHYFLKPKPNSCLMQHHHLKREGWPSDNDNGDTIQCETCRCHTEIKFVCYLLRGVSVDSNRLITF